MVRRWWDLGSLQFQWLLPPGFLVPAFASVVLTCAVPPPPYTQLPKLTLLGQEIDYPCCPAAVMCFNEAGEPSMGLQYLRGGGEDGVHPVGTTLLLLFLFMARTEAVIVVP